MLRAFRGLDGFGPDGEVFGGLSGGGGPSADRHQAGKAILLGRRCGRHGCGSSKAAAHERWHAHGPAAAAELQVEREAQCERHVPRVAALRPMQLDVHPRGGSARGYRREAAKWSDR